MPLLPPDPRPPVGQDVDPRMTLANERTFLAWMRTAIALIAGGLAAGLAFHLGSSTLTFAVAVPPVLLGAAVAMVGYRRWHAADRALRTGSPLPEARALWAIATAIVVLALLLAALIVVKHGG